MARITVMKWHLENETNVMETYQDVADEKSGEVDAKDRMMRIEMSN